MKALLDTNIIIHRESNKIVNQDIGTLFKWLDKGKYTKCVHPITVEEINKNPNKATVETFNVKLDSYELLQTVAPLDDVIKAVSDKYDSTPNDKYDTLLLNELYRGRVDLLISEDKKIHTKAKALGLSDSVFTIDSFLEKVVSEHPELINYKVLSVKQEYFGNINLDDSFFDSLKEDYPGFDKWFNKKANERAYITYNAGRVLSFLYLKVEGADENYTDIVPAFRPKKRLKVGTFKVVSNGVRLGERFLKIMFDNALLNRVDEIYVTIFDKRDDQRRLIELLEDWGFVRYGMKESEIVYVRDFSPKLNAEDPKLTYPYISPNTNIFLVPIYPQYHTELLPDSYLRNESPDNYSENEPHRNAISKVYICRSVERNVKRGDILVFYRTASGPSAYHTSVITTIGVVEDKIDGIKNENDFILFCKKRSIFADDYLKEFWNFKPNYRPFIIKFLYIYSFTLGNRLNRQRLLELGIIKGTENELRGLKKISKEQFKTILKHTNTNENLIID